MANGIAIKDVTNKLQGLNGEEVIPISTGADEPEVVEVDTLAAYGLIDAMDVAAFASSLSRKERTGEDLEEVREHDQFIHDVKQELSSLGIL